MDTIQLNQELYAVQQRLQKSGDAMYQLGNEMATAERDYRMALQQAILRLKAEKMSVTLILDIARGETADLKFKRDAAEARYSSAKESMRALQTAVSALQSIAKYQSDV